MCINTPEELEGLKKAGRAVAAALVEMKRAAKPGVTTRELDVIGEQVLTAHGARSAPRLTYNYPGGTCISIGPVIAHGIPGDAIIKPGDLINLDVSAELDGFWADTGMSIAIPPVKPANQTLLDATKAALWAAIRTVRDGQPLNAIGQAVEAEAKRRGFRLIRDLTGHGVGRSLHNDPENIFNYRNPRDRRVMKAGQALAIEPFLTFGTGDLVEDPDGWSLRTADGWLSAQFEHTVVVTDGKPVIVTLREDE